MVAWSSRRNSARADRSSCAGVRDSAASGNDDLDYSPSAGGLTQAVSGEPNGQMFPSSGSPLECHTCINGMVLGHGLCHGTALDLASSVDTRL